MNWLIHRDFLLPSGQYSRVQFMFWLFVPVILIVALVAKIWEFEKLLLRVSFYTGLLVFDTHLVSQIIAILLLLFMSYLILVAMIKRCNALGQSGWWIVLITVPIIGMLFLVYLLFWPGKTPIARIKTRNIPETVVMSTAAVVVFFLFTISSLLFGIYVLAGIPSIFVDKPMSLRIWNQTNEELEVMFVTSDGTVHQGYPVDKVRPNEIVKNDKILFRQGEYIVTAKNSKGETVYTKGINHLDLAEMNWIILIPPP